MTRNNHIPGHTQAAGWITRIRRWLASKWIVSYRLYKLHDRDERQVRGCFGGLAVGGKEVGEVRVSVEQAEFAVYELSTIDRRSTPTM
jgi:hypothetical protein